MPQPTEQICCHPLFPINAGDPGCVIELSDGLLQLAIEHGGTVGDDNDGIE